MTRLKIVYMPLLRVLFLLTLNTCGFFATLNVRLIRVAKGLTRMEMDPQPNITPNFLSVDSNLCYLMTMGFRRTFFHFGIEK